MAAKQRTVIPADPKDIYCDTCPSRSPDQGSQALTDQYARVRGWHIYRGPSIVDSAVNLAKALCPECVGTPRSKIETPTVLEGQSDIFEDLGVTLTPEPKGKRRKDGIN